jgi:glucose/arabinose dehydrogenase
VNARLPGVTRRGAALALSSLVAASSSLVIASSSLVAARAFAGAPSDLPVEPAPPPPPAEVAGAVALVEVAHGLSQPVWMTYAPRDPEKRLFVVEKTGTVRALRRDAAGKLLADGAPLLDVAGRLSHGQEQGLLGVAFHPKFPATPKLYIYYTDKHDNLHVAEFALRDGKIDYASERDLVTIKHPFNNHNGGQLLFGPDGKLWLGTGDGGWANDPFGNGQNRGSRLGKMMRLDADAPSPSPEIVLIGLRNPWRFDFDRKTGDLYIADVGQDRYEEIDVLPHDKIGGQNLGWKIMEGFHCRAGDDCDRRGLTLPVAEYNHKSGCSITGGFVYRGKALSQLDGAYFYADYCTAMIRSLRWSPAGVRDAWQWRPTLDPGMRLAGISSFAEDADGELYVITLEGTIYELVPKPKLSR